MKMTSIAGYVAVACTLVAKGQTAPPPYLASIEIDGWRWLPVIVDSDIEGLVAIRTTASSSPVVAMLYERVGDDEFIQWYWKGTSAKSAISYVIDYFDIEKESFELQAEVDSDGTVESVMPDPMLNGLDAIDPLASIVSMLADPEQFIDALEGVGYDAASAGAPSASSPTVVGGTISLRACDLIAGDATDAEVAFESFSSALAAPQQAAQVIKSVSSSCFQDACDPTIDDSQACGGGTVTCTPRIVTIYDTEWSIAVPGPYSYVNAVTNSSTGACVITLRRFLEQKRQRVREQILVNCTRISCTQTQFRIQESLCTIIRFGILRPPTQMYIDALLVGPIPGILCGVSGPSDTTPWIPTLCPWDLP